MDDTAKSKVGNKKRMSMCKGSPTEERLRKFFDELFAEDHPYSGHPVPHDLEWLTRRQPGETESSDE